MIAAVSRPSIVLVAEPLLVNAELAGRLCGVSGRTWQRMCSAGETPAPIRCGSRRRWNLDGPTGLRGWVVSGCPSRHRWEAMVASGAQAPHGNGRGAVPAAIGAGDRIRQP